MSVFFKAYDKNIYLFIIIFKQLRSFPFATLPFVYVKQIYILNRK